MTSRERVKRCIEFEDPDLSVVPDLGGDRRLDGAVQDFAIETAYGRDAIVLKLEPRRLWRCKRFAASAEGGRSTDEDFSVQSVRTDTGWQGFMRIPFSTIETGIDRSWPIRIDVQRSCPGHARQGWLQQHPWTPRLMQGSDNPGDLGWLLWK